MGVEQFEPELELMKNLNAKIILTHARITDRLDSNLRDCIKRIGDIAIPSAVTHNPGIVTPKLSSYAEVKIIMAPINLAGRFMNPSPNSTLDAISRTEKIVLGKKTLAAGLLQPREALNAPKLNRAYVCINSHVLTITLHVPAIYEDRPVAEA